MPETTQKNRSSKAPLIGLVVVAGALALLASVQQWIELRLLPGAATLEVLSVTGQETSSSLTLIALATLAAALVLTIAGRGFRRVIGVLIALLGAGLVAQGVSTLLDPLRRASGQVETVSGISGEAQATLVQSIDVSVWPAVTIALGAVLALAGLAVTVFGGRWKQGGRKYESGEQAKLSRAAGAATGDRISDWEALSDGDDPTDFDDEDAAPRA